MPIVIRGLSVRSPGPHARDLLADLNARLKDRTMTLVLGRTGSGKSTLLRTIAGLMDLSRGNIHFGEQEAPLWHEGRIQTKLLQETGIAFQFPEHQLFAGSVQREFDYSLRPWKLPPAERITRAREALGLFRLSAELLPVSPFILSGGQKRMVALGTSMVSMPPWLLLDEPSAGLDASAVRLLTEQLAAWKTHSGIVVATHDLDTFLPLADKVLLLRRGRLYADVTPQELAGRPELLLEAGIGLTSEMELTAALGAQGIRLPAALHGPQTMARLLAGQIRAAACGQSPAGRDDRPNGGILTHAAGSRLPQETVYPARAEVREAYLDDKSATPPLTVYSPNKDALPLLSEPEPPGWSDTDLTAGTKPIYLLDPKIKWVVYSLLSIGMIMQAGWTGTLSALAMAVCCVLALSRFHIRQIGRLSKPLFAFMAAGVLFSGIVVQFEPGLAFGQRFGFSAEQALTTARSLLTYFGVTLTGFVFTLSTSPAAMKHGLDQGLALLEKLGVRTSVLSLSASLILRFIPLIFEEVDRFALIAKARGKRTTARGRIRLRDLPVFVIPLLISLFQTVEELITAMELKNYASKKMNIAEADRWPHGTTVLGVGLLLFVLLLLIRLL